MVALETLDRAGWQVLRLSTDELCAEIVPGLGGTITSLRRRSDDLELLWSTPWGLRPPTAVRLPGSAEAARLDSSPGGWQSIFPNGSDHAVVHGVEWGHDGEARVAPCSWEQTPSSVVLRSRLTRSPFELTKIISIRRSEITVGETVVNVGNEHVDVVWGQQVLLGAPLLAPGATIDADATTVRPDARSAPGVDEDDVLPWPRAHSDVGMVNLRSVPEAGSSVTRTAYLSDFERPRVRVRNPALDVQVELSWDELTFPYAWYTFEAGGREGYPWYSAGYFLGLTPSTSWPARNIHDVRRATSTEMRIFPGVTRSSYVSLSVSGC